MLRATAVFWGMFLGGCANSDLPEPVQAPPTTQAEFCSRAAALMGSLNNPGQQAMLLEKMRNQGCLN